MNPYTIEIDCPPGDPRPGDLICGVIEDLNLTLGEPTSKTFGNWTWTVPADQANHYLTVQNTVRERLLVLHSSGLVRYASW